MTTATLVRIECPNEACPEYVRRGRRQVVGEAAPGSLVRLQCVRCRQMVTRRVTGLDEVIEGFRQIREAHR